MRSRWLASAAFPFGAKTFRHGFARIHADKLQLLIRVRETFCSGRVFAGLPQDSRRASQLLHNSKGISGYLRLAFAYAWSTLRIGVGLVANKTKLERIERHVDVFCLLCERIALRTLLFACFFLELGRFVAWLFR